MKDKASQAARQAGEQFRDTGEQIRESAQSTAEEFRKQGASFVQDRKVKAADQLNSFSAAIRSAADRLHEENDHNLAGYAEAAAERVEGAARYLGERDFSRIADDVESFARRQPELFLGGMFLAGMGISRFLKASRQRSSNGTSTPSAYTPASGAMRTPGTMQGASTPQTASTVRTTPGYRPAETELF
jgi:hypothetical protein